MSNQKLCNILYINVERKEMTANLNLKDKKIGFVLTGSFCTFSKTIPKMKELIEKGAEVIPIMSFNSYNLDTKFGKAQDFINEIEEITGKKIIQLLSHVRLFLTVNILLKQLRVLWKMNRLNQFCCNCLIR